MNSVKKWALTFIITFVISLLVFSMLAMAIGAAFNLPFSPIKLNLFNSNKNAAPEEQTQQLNGAEGDSTIAVPENKVIEGESFTVLLVGNDYLGDNSHSCADAIMVMRFSCETGKVVFLPIPGNTKVNTSGKTLTLAEFYNTKCKTQKDSRDVSVLEEKIEDMIDIEIDYYICTSLSGNGLGKLVDAVGGVEYFVPYDMNKEIEESKFEIDLKKGKQTLDGEEATAMLRYLDKNDYEARLSLGTDFMATLLSECTRKILDTQVVATFESLATKTNITEEVINTYVSTVYKYKEFENVFLTYPGDYQKNDDGEYLFYSDDYKAKELLKQYK